MRKILCLVMSLLVLLTIVSVSVAEESNCSFCGGVGSYTCHAENHPITKVSETRYCIYCKTATKSSSLSESCAACKGSGRIGKNSCFSCGGSGRSKSYTPYCSKCKRRYLCFSCCSLESYVCPFCNMDAYQEFVYNKVMRDPQTALGKAFFIHGTVMTVNDKQVTLEYHINETSTIIIPVYYRGDNVSAVGEANALKLLVGDEVIIYGCMYHYDDSIPYFFSVCAKLIE